MTNPISSYYILEKECRTKAAFPHASLNVFRVDVRMYISLAHLFFTVYKRSVVLCIGLFRDIFAVFAEINVLQDEFLSLHWFFMNINEGANLLLCGTRC